MISPRVLRHMSLVCLPEADEASLSRIFSFIVNRHLSMYKFESSVARMGNQIVEATTEIFREARKTLLPTPAKSHYLFNLRDLARVVQGIIMVRSVRV